MGALPALAFVLIVGRAGSLLRLQADRGRSPRLPWPVDLPQRGPERDDIDSHDCVNQKAPRLEKVFGNVL
jgi:hypothetical protein